MDFFELIEESSNSLTVNKIRTSLAMLGVIIGIGSVIALLGLGQASQKNVTDQISSLGTNLITINPSAANSGGVRSAAGTAASLTLDDAQMLESSQQITAIASVAPYVSNSAQLVAGSTNTNSTVLGVTASYSQVTNLEMQSGTFISDRNNSNLSRVVVLGPDVVTDLYGEGANPIGERIRLSGQSFTIVGVAATKGGTGRTNPDEYVYIPLQTAMRVVFGSDSLSAISVTAIDEESADLAADQITTVLLNSHNIESEDDADFRLFSQDDLLETATEVTGTFTTLLSGVAAISLVVGGIGIMNIMLVTVTERTKEIGLRKALGATKHTIIFQFLLEAVMITVIGGLIGIAAGIGTSYALSQSMELPFVISYTSIVLAFGTSELSALYSGSIQRKQHQICSQLKRYGMNNAALYLVALKI